MEGMEWLQELVAPDDKVFANNTQRRTRRIKYRMIRRSNARFVEKVLQLVNRVAIKTAEEEAPKPSAVSQQVKKKSELN